MSDIDDAIQAMTAAEEVGWDFETSGFNPKTDRIQGISVATSMKHAWYFPFVGPGAVPFIETMRALVPIFSNSEKVLVGSNLKFDLKFAKTHGLDIRCKIADTMVAHFLLWEEANHHGLKEIVKELLGVELATYKEVVQKRGTLFDDGDVEFKQYAKNDARYALEVWQKKLKPGIKRQKLERVFWTLEMEIVRVLVDMELNGVQMDRQWFIDRGKVLEVERENALKGVIAAAGKDFDPGSPKQTSQMLFDTLGIEPPPGLEMGKSKYYSTDDDVLTQIKDKHPVVSAIVKYRDPDKEINSFITPYLEKIQEDGRIYAEFQQARAKTGRFAGKDPNLQQVKKEGGMRCAFIAPPGKSLVCGDANQVEFRIAGHLALVYLGWSKIAEAYAQGLDLHKKTMIELGLERRPAKVVNFGFIYGRGWATFAKENCMPDEQAKAWRVGFHRAYPEVNKMQGVAVRELCEYGYVTTICGRRRRFPQLKGKGLRDKEVWWPGWVAWNAMVQGCQSLDGQILTASGYKALRDIQAGFDVLLTPYGPVRKYTVHDAGVKDGFAVSSSAGGGTYSADHRFGVYQDGGINFVKLKDLHVGDWVLGADAGVIVGAGYPCVELEAYLIGVLIGDGSYAARGAGVSFSSGKSLAYRAYLTQVVRKLWDAPLTWGKSKGSRGACWAAGICRVALRQRLLELGLERVSKTKKVIPDWVFASAISLRTAVLRGLMDTDGGFTGKRIVFTQKGKAVAEGVWRLLETLGIRARLVQHSTCWRVFVDPEFVEQYRDRVGFNVPEKQARLEKLVNGDGWLPPNLVAEVGKFILCQDETRELTSIRVQSNLILNGIKRERVTTLQKRLLFTDGEFHLLHRMKSGSGSRVSCRTLLERIPQSVERNRLLELCLNRWEQIMKIAPVGPVLMGDIETFEENHTYVGSGLTQHNSMADFIKLAMRNLHREILGMRAKDKRWFDVLEMMNVHDELVLEVPDELVPEVRTLLKVTAESAITLKVKLQMDVASGKTWATAKP